MVGCRKPAISGLHVTAGELAASASPAGSGPHHGPPQRCHSGSQSPLEAQRAPLKRRGLSRFFASKSQSFSCLADLCGTPYGQSALALSKDAHQHIQAVSRRLSRMRTRSTVGGRRASASASPSSSAATSSDCSSVSALEHADSLCASADSMLTSASCFSPPGGEGEGEGCRPGGRAPGLAAPPAAADASAQVTTAPRRPTSASPEDPFHNACDDSSHHSTSGSWQPLAPAMLGRTGASSNDLCSLVHAVSLSAACELVADGEDGMLLS